MIGAGCSAVRLKNVLQTLLNADVLLRSDAEVSDGDGSGEINAREQPANGDGEETQDGEEDEQASRAARDSNHQHGAEEEQEGEKAERDGPSQQLIKFIFIDERLEQLVRLRRLDEVECGFDPTDGFVSILRYHSGGVHHDGETGRVGDGHVPQVIDLQRHGFLL